MERILRAICKGMLTTIEKQLKDFLPGGVYGEAPNPKELERTKNSHLHNLPCEHHLGDLDASQKKRPNATFHYHSSLELLKRTRFLQWLSLKSPEESTALWRLARKHGSALRAKHKRDEEEENKKEEDALNKVPEKKGKKTKKLPKKKVTALPQCH